MGLFSPNTPFSLRACQARPAGGHAARWVTRERWTKRRAGPVGLALGRAFLYLFVDLSLVFNYPHTAPLNAHAHAHAHILMLFLGTVTWL